MALHTVTESDSFDTNIQMPADGDPADASDFESSSIRPLSNRTRWLWNRVSELAKFLVGGTITMTGDTLLVGAFRLTVPKLTVAAGYLDGMSLRKPKVYASGDHPVVPKLSPLTFNAIIFESSSIVATTELTIDDDADAIPVGFTVKVRNESAQIVNVNTYQGVGYANSLVLQASLGMSGEVIKTSTGPARWKVLGSGKD